MSESTAPATHPGAISWTDLTVPDADRVRDFYAAVAGWRAHGIDMGGYEDYCMIPGGAPEGTMPVAGICHARGCNEGQPACWMVYITVADLDHAMREVVAKGGQIVREPRAAGGGRFCVIKDPAGAIAGLYQAAPAKA
ncbi:MAG: VOC family protein [Phycisphaeraceae bacterium]|nr:VOC family protein [Phycisphaeraceae bacterium]